MKKIKYLLIAAILTATACLSDDDDANPSSVEYVEYETVPYTITASIIPMTDEIEGLTMKSSFDAGDIIEIDNPAILIEPAILTSNDCMGKNTATFSGVLKVSTGASLTSGVSTLTATLRNTDTADTLYNNGRPFVDVRRISSIAEGLKRYSYWACQNYTYNQDDGKITLKQNTAFVEFDLPIGGAYVTMTLGRAYYGATLRGNDIFAIPYGSGVSSNILQLDEKFDTDGKSIYKLEVGYQKVPDNCLPGLFSLGVGEYVYFAKGNLQYRPMDGAWRFAPTQYHRCFSDETNVGDDYSLWQGDDQWTDLLGFASWLEDGKPYSTSENSMDYEYPYDEEGNTLIGTCILGEQWSVLSFSEWLFLVDDLEKKGRASSAIVEGVEGIVLLPDFFTMPEGLVFYKAAYYDDDWNWVPKEGQNIYTAEEWQMMEVAGAVFLPATLKRLGSTVSIEETAYWTDTDGGFGGTGAVIDLDLEDGSIVADLEQMCIGNPVRLVYKVHD